MSLFISWLVQEAFNTVCFWLFGDRIPPREEMKAVGTVTKLCLYPLKSGHRIETDSFRCEDIGPCLGDTVDRSFVATDEAGGFLTARRYPEMVLIRAEPCQDGLRLSAPGVAPLTVSVAEVAALDRRCQVRVWDDRVPALDCGDAAAAWLTRAIASRDGPSRLRWFPSRGSARAPRVPPFPLRASDGSAFADLTGYMLLNAASVEELNSRLPAPVSCDNFRPNILVSGSEPFAEDRWRFLAIGDALFENVMPCTRCLFTSINAETGVKDPRGEPLKTLRQFRVSDDPVLTKALGDSPLFGINLGLRQPGVIKVGDVIYASEK